MLDQQKHPYAIKATKKGDAGEEHVRSSWTINKTSWKLLPHHTAGRDVKVRGSKGRHQLGGREHQGDRGGTRMGRHWCGHWYHPGDRVDTAMSLLLLLRRMRGDRPLGGESPKRQAEENRSGGQDQPHYKRPQRRWKSIKIDTNWKEEFEWIGFSGLKSRQKNKLKILSKFLLNISSKFFLTVLQSVFSKKKWII